MNFFAHSHPDFPDDFSRWEPLFTPFGEIDPNDPGKACSGKNGAPCLHCERLAPDHGHLNKVAWWTSKFAAEMFSAGSNREAARQWGYFAGLWHDLGKFAPKWQEYLAAKVDTHSEEATGCPSKREDHSSAGAVFSNALPPFGALLSYLIAGHHAGLADASYLFYERLSKPINEWRAYAEAACVPLEEKRLFPPLHRADAGGDGLAFLNRYFFSALVDADFLATESFMSPERKEARSNWPEDILHQMLETLEGYLAEKFASPKGDPVHLARETVRQDCIRSSEKPSGFYSLTVPTGGGKTLSSLLFALRHALKNGHRRVILVIPFTSIITQNTHVFREAFAPLTKKFGHEIVLEQHSKFDPVKETERNRLSAENWDSPLIVTTNAQFFESLFANRASVCRKLHRTARSVIIFDEVQALPVALLHPILRGLRCLVHDLGSTAVLCTATQPALDRREGFPIGIPPEEITEIIQNKPALFQTLERVTCQNLGARTDGELISHILENAPKGGLLILNTTKAAQIWHQKLSEHTTALHLSARMCPRHIMLVLAQAKRLRKKGKPVVLVSTQLVEAGVDISFPVVYRAECGLDSFAQAAGRCNRNGELKDANGRPIKGQAFLFEPTDHPIPSGLNDLADSASVTRSQIIPNLKGRDLLDPDLIRLYFEHAIWSAGPKTDHWDKAHIVSGEACFNPNSLNFRIYCYKTAAERFRLIDSKTYPVLIPWGKKGRELCEEIRNLKKQNRVPNRSHYRRAQQFTVQVYDGEWQQLKSSLSFHCEEAFAILDHPEDGYHPQTGLKRPGSISDPNAYIR